MRAWSPRNAHTGPNSSGSSLDDRRARRYAVVAAGRGLRHTKRFSPRGPTRYVGLPHHARPAAGVRLRRVACRSRASCTRYACCAVRSSGSSGCATLPAIRGRPLPTRSPSSARKLQIEPALPFDLWARTHASLAAWSDWSGPAMPRWRSVRPMLLLMGDAGRRARCARAASGRLRDPGDVGVARDRQGRQGAHCAGPPRVLRRAARALARSRAGFRRARRIGATGVSR